MKKRFLIVGLRVIGPTILHQQLPGYLGSATENHRQGFRFTGEGVTDKWMAFYPDPMNENVFHIANPAHGTQLIESLLQQDNGWFRPLVLLPIYI